MSRRLWIARVAFVFVLAIGALMVALGGAASSAARRPSRNATVSGYVQLCGGPAPGRCWKGKAGFCQQPQGCVTTSRVAVIDVRGRRVATQRLHRARFRFHLVPGHYTVELLGDGKRVHGRVMQTKKITARAHRTTVVRFLFAVP